MIYPKRAPANLMPATNAQLMYLVERMRADEIAQYEAFFGAFDPETAAAFFIAKPAPRVAIIDEEGFPVVAGGYEQIFPGVWSSWMLGTQQGWEKHWRTITKGSRWLIGQIMNSGARRVQTNVLTDRRKTCEWYMRGLGLSHEGDHPGFGLGGECVSDYALVGANNGS